MIDMDLRYLHMTSDINHNYQSKQLMDFEGVDLEIREFYLISEMKYK
jgi:hypothetical protein